MHINIYAPIALGGFDNVHLFAGILRAQQRIHRLLEHVPRAGFPAVYPYEAFPFIC